VNISLEAKRNIPSPMACLETKFYDKAVGSWDSPQIEIISLDGKAIARIPHAFLTRGGQNTWEYILHVVNQLVLETGGWIYLSGAPVDLRLAPSPGLYVYAVDGKLFFLDYADASQDCIVTLFLTYLIILGLDTVSFRPGPTYTTFAKPADVDGSVSTSRTTTGTTSNNQVRAYRAKLAMAIDTIIAASQHTARFQGNGSRSGHILSHQWRVHA